MVALRWIAESRPLKLVLVSEDDHLRVGLSVDKLV